MKFCRFIALVTALVMMSALFVSCSGNDSGETKADPWTFESITDGTDSETESQTETETETEPAPRDSVVRFFAAGDNIIHECVYLDAMTQATSVGAPSEYYFSGMYSNLKDKISSADLAFINAEGPLDTDYGPNGYPSFNAPKEAGDALVDVGFDIVNLANNHMLDYHGAVGLKGTIKFWKTKDVMTVGGYEGEADYNTVRTIERNGIKIAVLSYTYGTNGNYLPAGTTDLWIPYIDDADITRHIAEAKNIADCVIVSMHWGNENTFDVTAEQQRLAKLIANAGADVIIGHHSHTIQPIEWVEGQNGHRTLVTYSLGNFLHTQLYSYNIVGGTVTFDIVKNAGTGEVTIENPVFDPTVCHYTANMAVLDSLDYYKRENIKIYRLAEYTDALASGHGSQKWNSFSLATLKGYVNSTIKPEFLPSD
ncbi:MAG: CapA family protein [Clostridia bacterium]|nr:CapA family protein [Clostridia bacterium]